MWKRFGSVLRCSLCSGALQLSVFEEQQSKLSANDLAVAKKRGLLDSDFATYVESGLLCCATCRVKFPIFKGLPVLLPYATDLHGEFKKEFGAHLMQEEGYRFADHDPVPGERFVLRSFSTEWLAYHFDGVIWEMDYADHERRFLTEFDRYRPEHGSGGNFLELGCGIGITTHLAQKNFGVDAVGVDLSLASLRATSHYRANPFLHFVQASVFYLPFAEGQFDTIYSRGVLHHTFSTEKAFTSLARFARPGAAVYLWVYGPKSINDNALRRGLFIAEKAVRRMLSGRDSGTFANLILWPFAGAYVLFNQGRRLRDRTVQPYNFRRALHAARDRFTPEFAHRHSDTEVIEWFKSAGFVDLEVVDWKSMPIADHDDYRRNTGVRGRKAAKIEGQQEEPETACDAVTR
jgi:ubiquinone/menaquinone biosynthesis C-methylase UbiE/uncharacterized protein YbaR (Trm112 family)